MSSYPGGKNGAGVYQRLINMMPPHRTYVEPFLGGGAVMRAKRPAARASLGIDADRAPIEAARFWDVPGLELIQGDALEQLRFRRWDPHTLVYADPPYLFSTRAGGDRPIYAREFGTEGEHVALLKLLASLPCMVMVSGYPSDLYGVMLDGWRVETFQAMTRGGSMATEAVWCNFPPPAELHDYRYLGTGYRERERIKRKKARWRARLEGMPLQERYAVLSVLEDLRAENDGERSPIVRPGAIDVGGGVGRRESPATAGGVA